MSPPLSDVTQAASGAIIAQNVVECLRDGAVDATFAWLKFCELAAVHGRHSAACRAFVEELAKRARA